MTCTATTPPRSLAQILTEIRDSPERIEGVSEVPSARSLRSVLQELTRMETCVQGPPPEVGAHVAEIAIAPRPRDRCRRPVSDTAVVVQES